MTPNKNTNQKNVNDAHTKARNIIRRGKQIKEELTKDGQSFCEASYLMGALDMCPTEYGSESRDTVSETYVGTQTPIERLRNKLTPFMNIIELLDGEDNLTLPFVDKSPNSDFKNEMFERLLELCIKYKEDIKMHLSDCETFYNK